MSEKYPDMEIEERYTPTYDSIEEPGIYEDVTEFLEEVDSELDLAVERKQLNITSPAKHYWDGVSTSYSNVSTKLRSILLKELARSGRQRK